MNLKVKKFKVVFLTIVFFSGCLSRHFKSYFLLWIQCTPTQIIFLWKLLKANAAWDVVQSMHIKRRLLSRWRKCSCCSNIFFFKWFLIGGGICVPLQSIDLAFLFPFIPIQCCSLLNFVIRVEFILPSPSRVATLPFLVFGSQSVFAFTHGSSVKYLYGRFCS